MLFFVEVNLVKEEERKKGRGDWRRGKKEKKKS